MTYFARLRLGLACIETLHFSTLGAVFWYACWYVWHPWGCGIVLFLTRLLCTNYLSHLPCNAVAARNASAAV